MVAASLIPLALLVASLQNAAAAPVADSSPLSARSASPSNKPINALLKPKRTNKPRSKYTKAHGRRGKQRLDDSYLLDVEATLDADARVFRRQNHHDHDHVHDGDHDHDHDRRQLLDIEVGHPSTSTQTVTYSEAAQPEEHAAGRKLVSIKHGSHTHSGDYASQTGTFYDGSLLDLDVNLKRDEHIHEHDHERHDHDDVHVHKHEHRDHEHEHEEEHHRHHHHHDHDNDRRQLVDVDVGHSATHKTVTYSEAAQPEVQVASKSKHDSHTHSVDYSSPTATSYDGSLLDLDVNLKREETVHDNKHAYSTPLFSVTEGHPLTYVGKKPAAHRKRQDMSTTTNMTCPDLAEAVRGYLQLVTPADKPEDAVPVANLVLSDETWPTSTFGMTTSNDTAMVMMVATSGPNAARNGTIPTQFVVQMYDQRVGEMSCLCASFNPYVATPLTLLSCHADLVRANVSQTFLLDGTTDFVSPLWNTSFNAHPVSARAVPPPGTFFAQDGAAENLALPKPGPGQQRLIDDVTQSASPVFDTKQTLILTFRPAVDVLRPYYQPYNDLRPAKSMLNQTWDGPSRTLSSHISQAEDIIDSHINHAIETASAMTQSADEFAYDPSHTAAVEPKQEEESPESTSTSTDDDTETDPEDDEGDGSCDESCTGYPPEEDDGSSPEPAPADETSTATYSEPSRSDAERVVGTVADAHARYIA